ncbi:MAG: M20/M25/M40 family metallo-hydrolase [Saprospiraceae bacterium]|nr:M20/M25/M40 family metallo-hydrolase [Saprospiraceae bacterium]
MKSRMFLLNILLLLAINTGHGQKNGDEDALMLKEIHNFVLSKGKCHEWLHALCKGGGPRLAGHAAYDSAVVITSKQLASIKGVKVSAQATKTHKWIRGAKEVVDYISPMGEITGLNALALGNSIGTGEQGLLAEVVEVFGLDDVEKMGEFLRGKVVFYNRAMDPTALRTFTAYGGAVDQRVYGASRAAKYGALAVLVRSMTTEIDDYPHTGTLIYTEGIKEIPALAISTMAAEKLSAMIKAQGGKVFIRNTSHIGEIQNCDNVIGELKGSEYPEKVIVVGGHLDAWDVGEGAHDDGSGCVQAMEVLHTIVSMGYKPRHTIRCVLFANEENGLAGGKAYAQQVLDAQEIHVAAIESDAGGFSPRGFSFDADTSVIKKYFKKVYTKFLPLLEPYGLQLELGGSGADIGPLKPCKGLLAGLRPDSQRYFDFHHTSRDVFENVHPRELKLGAAAMVSLVFLIDKYGIED